MQHTRLYVIQVLGILLLLCGYFLSDRPDSLSVMHFDPTAPSEISSITKSNDNTVSVQTSVSSQNNSNRKTDIPKYFSFELILPFESVAHVHTYGNVVYAYPLPEEYNYLFYEEINPPPPEC